MGVDYMEIPFMSTTVCVWTGSIKGLSWCLILPASSVHSRPISYMGVKGTSCLAMHIWDRYDMILYSRSRDARPCDWCPGRWCRHWWRPLIDCVYCDCVTCSPWSLCWRPWRPCLRADHRVRYKIYGTGARYTMSVWNLYRIYRYIQCNMS